MPSKRERIGVRLFVKEVKMGEWTKVASKKDLPVGKFVGVSVGNKRIAIFNVDGKYYAIDDECTHAGGTLSEGEVNGTVVTCPWHGATFEVTSGAVLSEPAFESVNAYPVHVEGDEIKVEI